MTPTERLRALALEDAFEVWYPSSFDREEEPDMYEALLNCDPTIPHRIVTVEYRIELATEDKIYVTYRHLKEDTMSKMRCAFCNAAIGHAKVCPHCGTVRAVLKVRSFASSKYTTTKRGKK